MSNKHFTSQQFLQKTTIDYDQYYSKITEDKDRTCREIYNVLEELMNFKTYIELAMADLHTLYKDK